MKEDSKQLFGAPFIARNNVSTWGIEREDESLVAVVFNQPNMSKIARLFMAAPTLYDALCTATKSMCSSADFRCPKQGAAWSCCKDCKVLPLIELLRKIKDGK